MAYLSCKIKSVKNMLPKFVDKIIYGKCLRVLMTPFLSRDRIPEQLDKLYNNE